MAMAGVETLGVGTEASRLNMRSYDQPLRHLTAAQTTLVQARTVAGANAKSAAKESLLPAYRRVAH